MTTATKKPDADRADAGRSVIGAANCTSSRAAEQGAAIKTVRLPIDQLHVNAYNPNRLTDEEFAELVAEVRHLGRLPKPIVIRQNEQTHEIVDGEHGWKAAKEAGLPEVDCEVIDADDFESMRQTYKRNQHGTHNPVLLGQMFRRMMEARKLSQRKLAKEMQVSEGTIRNALEYAKAAEKVRNGYAPDGDQADGDEVRNDYALGTLSVRQVRLFNRLPKVIGGWWLGIGADLKVLFEVKSVEQLEEADWLKEWRENHVVENLSKLEKSGLTEYVKQPHKKSGFADAIKQLREWDNWERRWVVGGIKRSELRKYTQHRFKGVWCVDGDWKMDSVLEYIVDRKTAEFLLTPEEFSEHITAADVEGSSTFAFEKRLELAVYKKHGRKPDSDYHVRRELMQLDIDREAPDFIKESDLNIEKKHDLLERFRAIDRDWGSTFKEDVSRDLKEKVLRDLASGARKVYHSETTSEAVNRLIDLERKQAEQQKRWQEWIDSKSESDLAKEIADEFYDDKDKDLKHSLQKKLETFTKSELLTLREIAFGREEFRMLEARIRALLGGA